MSKHSCESPSKVLKCNCPHEMQDRIHGRGMRLHNPCKENEYRCTVCGDQKRPHTPAPKKTGKVEPPKKK